MLNKYKHHQVDATDALTWTMRRGARTLPRGRMETLWDQWQRTQKTPHQLARSRKEAQALFVAIAEKGWVDRRAPGVPGRQLLTSELRQPVLFWPRVGTHGALESSCWEWSGARSPAGYGSYHLRSSEGSARAHRVALSLAAGWEACPPPEVSCCHKCDNPPCCNPHHLIFGTAKDNADDRTRTPLRNRHPAP